jgi:hypothetical protein
LHLKNILKAQNALGLGLDIDTPIDVRRAQLAYKLSDEVTLFLYNYVVAYLLFFIFGMKFTSTLIVIEQYHFIFMLGKYLYVATRKNNVAITYV